jgi:colanic acid biosynthesis glycosyl transferase WcaI
MRILVVTQYFWPENFRINDLVRALKERGHALTVLTGEPNYPGGEDFPEYLADKAKFGAYGGIPVLRVPMFARGQTRPRLLLNYISFALSASVLGLWKLRGKDFYEPSPITVGIPAAVLRWRKKAPMAFWVLDLWPQTLQAVGIVQSRLLLSLVGRLVQFIYARCDLIWAQSHSFVTQIRHYAKPQTPIAYFPNWAESVFDGVPAVAAPEVQRIEGIFTIVFAGNIGEAQDFPAILHAAERLKAHANIRWIVLGDGRMRAWVVEEIRRRGLQDRMELLGSYPVERMPSFFAHADALLVSLKNEPIFAMTIPGKLQSYLACGIPVLGMLNGEGADIIRNHGVGLSAPAGDALALKQAVLALMRMPAAERAEMGTRGRRLYEEQFERSRLVEKAETLLQSLLPEKQPGAGQ